MNSTGYDPRREHAIAQLDMFERVYAGLRRSVSARAAYARQVAADMGVSAEKWSEMGLGERERLLAEHRRLVRRDMDVSLRRWRAMDYREKYDWIDAWRVKDRPRSHR
jgi:hypothetical protein